MGVGALLLAFSARGGCKRYYALSSQIAYDADGNLTNDTFHTYQWDANGHASAVGGINVIYDALGRAVEGQFPDGGKSEKVYDETGLNAVMLGQSMGVARIPLPGGAWARYTPSGLSDYWHPDWLGTSRLESTPGRTVDVDAAFAPFGEVYTHADNFDLTFTGNTTTDTVIDMYDFPYRRYHPVQGRWISPDPARGTGNKYVYADNNPLSKVDPYGLEAILINGIDYGGVDAEFEGDKFENPLAQGESTPPAATQTPAQPTTEQSQGPSQGEATATTGNQQKAQANQEANKAQPEQQSQTETASTLPLALPQPLALPALGEVVKDILGAATVPLVVLDYLISPGILATENKDTTKTGGPKATDAPGVTAGGQATDAYGRKLGPSGEPQVNETNSNTREGARNRALGQGSGAVEHANPKVGKPHFHPTDAEGNKKPGSTHHNYPED